VIESDDAEAEVDSTCRRSVGGIEGNPNSPCRCCCGCCGDRFDSVYDWNFCCACFANDDADPSFGLSSGSSIFTSDNMIERIRTGLRSEYLQFEVLVRLLSGRSVFHRLPPDRLVIPLSFFYFVYGSLNEGRRVEVGSSGGPDDGRGKGRDANWIRVQWNGFGEVDLQCSAVTDSLDTRVDERANVLIEFWGPMTQYACDAVWLR
jgi:hypothetical protein